METVAGVAHGLLSLLTVSWWQSSLGAVRLRMAVRAVAAVRRARVASASERSLDCNVITPYEVVTLHKLGMF